MDELDIWRAANILMKQYPEDADLVAARRADALLDQGDIDGFHVWKRVVAAISELARKTRATDEPLN